MREHTQNCGHVREQTQFSGHVHEHNFTQYLSVLSLQLIGNNNRQTSLCIYRWLLDGNVYIHKILVAVIMLMSASDTKSTRKLFLCIQTLSLLLL